MDERPWKRLRLRLLHVWLSPTLLRLVAYIHRIVEDRDLVAAEQVEHDSPGTNASAATPDMMLLSVAERAETSRPRCDGTRPFGTEAGNKPCGILRYDTAAIIRAKSVCQGRAGTIRRPSACPSCPTPAE